MAGAAVAVGIQRDHRELRWMGILVFGLATAKAFLVDAEALSGLYRVLGFLGLGALLLLASYGYQRMTR